MLFILYGGHTSMGYAAREFFRSNGISVIPKYHYCPDTPALTTQYERRNFVDELTFLRNTDTSYRYTAGNIQTGFNQQAIDPAVNGSADHLLTLSGDCIHILRRLKERYGSRVYAIFSYTEDGVLERHFHGLGVSPAEAELRCAIGRANKASFQANMELFDCQVVFGGENSAFDARAMAAQCQTLYAKVREERTGGGVQEDILQYVTETQRILVDFRKEVNDKLDRLTRFITGDLQEELKWQKELYRTLYGTSDDERAIATLSAGIGHHISVCLQRDYSNMMRQEEARLRHLFDSTWEKLLPDTRTTLLSAALLWQNCPGPDVDFDYSGVCLTVTSALENELKYWFFAKYKEFLLEKYGDPAALADPYSQWPEELLDVSRKSYEQAAEKPEVHCTSLFTLGSLPFLFYNGKNAQTRMRMREYLDTVCKNRYRACQGGAIAAMDWINFPRRGKREDWSRDPNSFVSRCEQVRSAYRNPAAHAGVLPREDAQACYHCVIGRVDAYDHLSRVQGLIMALYEYLAA